ncbi:MAG: hypothetical protein QOK18_1758, partial [Mycobacterium sp.]|nr:hypothetical protein [Mycobacterium sp.]
MIAPFDSLARGKTIVGMNLDLERLLEEQGGVATSGQLLDLVTR